MARYSKDQIAEVVASVDVVDVVGGYVSWDMRKSVTGRRDMWACCPAHGEKTPSFHVMGQRQTYHCFGCGISGDALRFLTDVQGMAFPVALQELARMGGVRLEGEREETERERQQRAARRAQIERRRAEDERRQKADEIKKVERASDIWKATLDLRGSLAETYLLSRHIRIRSEPNLRFHPGLDHPAGGKFPALVGRVQDAEGRGRAVWRIFLSPDGTDKAFPKDGPPSKLGLGPARGGAVRLASEDAEEIGIGEGIETCAAARILDPRLPIWAGLSTSGIIGFQPPAHVKFVRIFPDGDKHRRRNDGIADPPGYEAARKLAQRLMDEGRVRVEIVPFHGVGDYADLLSTLKKSKIGA